MIVINRLFKVSFRIDLLYIGERIQVFVIWTLEAKHFRWQLLVFIRQFGGVPNLSPRPAVYMGWVCSHHTQEIDFISKLIRTVPHLTHIFLIFTLFIHKLLLHLIVFILYPDLWLSIRVFGNENIIFRLMNLFVPLLFSFKLFVDPFFLISDILLLLGLFSDVLKMEWLLLLLFGLFVREDVDPVDFVCQESILLFAHNFHPLVEWLDVDSFNRYMMLLHESFELFPFILLVLQVVKLFRLFFITHLDRVQLPQFLLVFRLHVRVKVSKMIVKFVWLLLNILN